MPVLTDRLFSKVFRAHFYPSSLCLCAALPAVPCTGNTGNKTRAASQGFRSELALELRHHLSPHHHARDLPLPLSGYRSLQPESSALGFCRTGSPSHCSQPREPAFSYPTSKSRRKPLTLLADNGNAKLVATPESRLEELGVLRFFPRPRESNDNTYSEFLFRATKHRHDYPRRPSSSKDKACQWVVSFVD